MGQMDAPSSLKIVKLVFLRKLDAEPKEGIRRYRAIALTSVMLKRYASCIIFFFWKRRRNPSAGGSSCQHLQVMMTKFAAQTLGMAEVYQRAAHLHRLSVERPYFRTVRNYQYYGYAHVVRLGFN